MENQKKDVMLRRQARKWSRFELLKRVLWSSCHPFFRYSPRIFWGYRRALLRAFGAQVGEHVNIYPSVEIMIPWNLSIGDYATVGDGATLYALGQIRIGSGATVSQGAHLCAGTHDYEAAAFTLIKSSVTIEDRAWICADAFVGPGVTIGKGAVVAARAVAVKSVEDWAVVGGNPAKMIKVRLMRD